MSDKQREFLRLRGWTYDEKTGEWSTCRGEVVAHFDDKIDTEGMKTASRELMRVSIFFADASTDLRRAADE